MSNYLEGCLICGSSLEYFDDSKIVACSICGNEKVTNSLCCKGHYVCDSCHEKKAFEEIKEVMLSTDSVNPIEIADEMMNKHSVHMHGPEHHFLVTAALLAAYINKLNINDSVQIKHGIIDKQELITKAEERASSVPGGICGFWGSCGAAVGSGIFISLITGATPLTVDSWSKSNLAVSKALKIISENGGPRCCKRNVYLSINSTIDFLEENMDVQLETSENIDCSHYGRNNECKRESCKFFPHKHKD